MVEKEDLFFALCPFFLFLYVGILVVHNDGLVFFARLGRTHPGSFTAGSRFSDREARIYKILQNNLNFSST